MGALGLLLAAAIFGPACAAIPVGDDRPELSKFAQAAGPGVPMEITPLLFGRATQPEFGMVGDASCLHFVDQVYVAYLVKHPKGTFLIDAGLSSHVDDDLAKFSFAVRQAFRFEHVDSLGHALQTLNVKPDFVILTHVHWDHSSGLTDIPGTKFVTDADDLDFIHKYNGAVRAVRPDHFEKVTPQVFKFDGPPIENFTASHDMFGDGSVELVPLPGHTPGALGVLLSTVHGKRLLFIGDAAWLRDGYRIPSHRPGPMSKLVDADRDETSDTLWRLYHFAKERPDVVIVPAHDGEALKDVEALNGEKK